MTPDAPVALLAALVLVGAVLAVAVPLSLLQVPPAIPLAAYAFVLPWGSTLSFPGAPDPFNTLSTLVGLLTSFSLLLHLFVHWRRIRAVETSVLIWLALIGWLALTLLWSVAPGRSVKALAVLVSLMGLFVLGSLIRLRPQELRWVELGAVAGGLVVAAQALLTTARGGLQNTSSELPRFTYDDGDPNIIAATLLLPLALSLWWALTATGGLRRLAGTGASLALFGGIFVTGSRGGLLSAVVVLLVVLAVTPGLPLRRAAAYLGGLGLLVAVLLLAVPEGLRSHLSDTDSTGRSAIWRIGLQACLSTCDVGSGYGTFGAVYRSMYLDDLSLQGFGDRTYAAHNAFLSILVEAGLPGLVLLVLGFVLLIRSLLLLERRWRGAALGALAGLLMSNMLVSNLGFKYFWMTLLYGTLVVTTHRRQRDRGPAAAPVLTGSAAP